MVKTQLMRPKLMWISLVVAFLPMMLLRDFTPANEARYLVIADEALRNGRFFSFTLHGLPYADKPPLYLWLVMACRQLLGHHSILALSLLSFLPSIAVVKIMDSWTRHSLSAPSRQMATLMLFTTVYFTGAAVVVRMDMLMCLFIVLALRSFWRLYSSPHAVHSEQWLMGLWLFLALFSKGPLGLLIPLVATLAFLLFKRRGRDIGRLWNWRSWLVLFVGCVGWFSMTYYEAGGDYIYDLVFRQTVGRGINSFHHARPFYYYLISIWYEWQPWSLLCVGGLLWAFLRKPRLGELYKFFLCIVVATLVLLSLISSKLQIYLLPAFPFVIYGTAHIVENYKHCRWMSWAIGIPEAVLALTLPALLVSRQVLSLPLLHLPLIAVAAALLSLFAATSLYWLAVRKSTVGSIVILAYGVLGTLFVAGLAMPMVNPYIV